MLFELFTKIINMSLTASVVILVVWVARGFLWKVPKKYAYVLWLIVGIRLLCPVGIASPLSIYNFVGNGPMQIEQYKNAKQNIDVNHNNTKNDVSQNTNSDFKTASNGSLKTNTEIVNDNAAKEQSVSSSNYVIANNTSEDIDGGVNSFIKIGSYVWVSVCVMIALWNIYLMFRMKRKVFKSVRFKENIYECENIPTPFVMGLISPKIYIPFRLKKEEQTYIINHEKFHIKRKDNVVKMMAFFICCIYWFHPLVWISYLLMIRDMEMSCDEYVLQKSPEDIRVAYSESLLGFAMNKRNFGVGFLAFGESDTRKRVKHIMKFKGYGKWIGIVAIILLIVVGMSCLTNSNKKDSKEELKRGKVEDNRGFHLKEISKVKGNFSIPNPATIEKTAEVVLHKCKYKGGESKPYCVEQENEPTYDLSFLGLKNRVYVTNFDVGNITGDGECLVLALEEKHENVDQPENYAYLAVLDYKNRKSYLTRTDVIAGQGRDEQLNLYDITGDGREELIFSSEPNMVVVWNIYRFAGENLKKIYSNNENTEMERDGFEIKLLDDYKAKIVGYKFDFEQTISLLDLGYQKNDLEYVDPNNLEKSDNVGRRAYKNGRLIRKDEDSSWRIQICALMAENWTKNYAEYNYFKEIDREKGICIPLRVVLGDEEVGRLDVYLKYDLRIDGMKIVQVKFINNVDLTQDISSNEIEDIQDKNILKVLKNEKKYYNTEFKKELYLKDYSSGNTVSWNYGDEKCTYDDDSVKEDFKIAYWCEVDMDGDGNKEIILQSDRGTELVLYSAEDIVYAWAFRFRSMKNIKLDGTFESSGGAADTEIWKLQFRDGECYCEEMCVDDELKKGEEIYRLNKKASSKRKVKEYLEQQNQKEEVVWMKY